jgi:hypothetical protein
MPQKDTLDRAAYTCMLVSYRRLSPPFQFSLSGVTLVYLSQCTGPSCEVPVLYLVYIYSIEEYTYICGVDVFSIRWLVTD